MLFTAIEAGKARPGAQSKLLWQGAQRGQGDHQGEGFCSRAYALRSRQALFVFCLHRFTHPV
jgi:hypothetical protein